jgi:hypothetical protein
MRFLFKFILTHSIFVAFCAVALCIETTFYLPIEISPQFYLLVFFATITTYNFYWLLSKFYFKPLANVFNPSNFSYLLICFVGVLGAFYFGLQISLPITYLIFAGICTLAYSLPLWPFVKFKLNKQLGFLKTILLAFTWAYITVILPVVSATASITSLTIYFFWIRFCFMLMLCIIFDNRDTSKDSINGLGSIATQFSGSAIDKIFYTILILFTIMSFYFVSYFYTLKLVLPFLVVGLFCLFLFIKSKTNKSYNFYYLVVDGMMIFSMLLHGLFAKLITHF